MPLGGALLPEPLRITIDPAVTTWAGPALAMGGSCKAWRLLLNLEAGGGDDVALFNEDEGDAK